MNWRIDRKLYDKAVRQSYEHLLMAQPQLKFGGLWFKGSAYYIVCCALTPQTMADDGTPLAAWYAAHSQMGTPPTSLVRDPPGGAERIQGRSAEDLALLRDSSRTFPEVVLALNLALPREFPNFRLDDEGGTCSAVFTAKLSDEQLSVFQAACHAVGTPHVSTIRVEPNVDFSARQYFGRPRIGDADSDLYLTPSRRLSTTVPQRLRWMVEDDEDFWRDHRERLLAAATIERPEDVLPKTWKVPEASCIVDPRAAPAVNLRNHLSIFRQILLVLPTVDQLERKLQELCVTERDLVELVRLGRVSLLLPESIDRYPYTVVEPLAEDSPERLLCSRRLAAATVVDTRRRFPLFFPTSSMEERYEILHELSRAAAQADREELRRFRLAAVKALASSWDMGELALHHSGAAMTSMFGMGLFCSELVKAMTGEDRWFEFITTAAGIEWSGALGASIAPSPGTDPYTSIIASYYSRIPSEGVPSVRPEVYRIIERILVLDDDTPIVPFATAFANADIDRLRDCVQDLARWNPEPDHLEKAIDRFNDSVRAYERKPHKLTAFDIVALAPIAAGATGALSRQAAFWIAFGMWIIKNLAPFAGNSLAQRSKAISAIFDRTSALLTRAQPDAVLVARMRKQTKG